MPSHTVNQKFMCHLQWPLDFSVIV